MFETNRQMFKLIQKWYQNTLYTYSMNSLSNIKNVHAYINTNPRPPFLFLILEKLYFFDVPV